MNLKDMVGGALQQKFQNSTNRGMIMSMNDDESVAAVDLETGEVLEDVIDIRKAK